MITELAKNIEFRNVIVSNIELQNGTHTQIITIFNANEFDFEEMKIGLDYGLQRIHKDYVSIKSVQTTFNSLKNATLKPFARYQKQEFNNLKQ